MKNDIDPTAESVRVAGLTGRAVYQAGYSGLEQSEISLSCTDDACHIHRGEFDLVGFESPTEFTS